jgi:hypothetical protein
MRLWKLLKYALSTQPGFSDPMKDFDRAKVRTRYAKKMIRTEYYGTASVGDLKVGYKQKEPKMVPGYIWAPYVPILRPPGYVPSLRERLRRIWLLLTGRLIPVNMGEPRKDRQGNTLY